jgi:hypothetical protein
LVVLPLGLALTALLSCVSNQDAAFRTEVRNVLFMAESLEFATDFIAESSPNERDRRLSEAKVKIHAYQAAVTGLPVPHDKRLRYLAMRLRDIGQQADAVANWSPILWHAGVVGDENERLTGSDSTSRALWNSTWEGREASVKCYQEAYRVLPAAERVCLGTSLLADHDNPMAMATAKSPMFDWAQRSDSVMQVNERFVRGAIAKLR